MNPKDISQAKNPDLRNSLAALRRAGELARETAILSGTSLIVRKNGQRVRIPAQTLSAEAATKAK